MAETHDLHIKNLYNIDGLVCLVTGGGTGIGLMITQALAANGAKVVYIGSRREDVLQKSAEEHSTNDTNGGHIVPIQLDVTDKDSILAAVKRIEEEHGKLDILVNSAGMSGPKSKFFSSEPPPADKKKTPGAHYGPALFNNESFASWSDLLTMNVAPLFFVTCAFLPLLEKATLERQEKAKNSSEAARTRTSVVLNIGSISGIIKLSQDHFAYNSSKAAANHLTKMLATEFALKGIRVRVNGIAPGVFPSEMTAKDSNEANKSILDRTQEEERGLTDLPAGRSGVDEDMAGTALYLASTSGQYVNGQVLVVDGGFTATEPSAA